MNGAPGLAHRAYATEYAHQPVGENTVASGQLLTTSYIFADIHRSS
jgi:hypothetical protein